MSYFSTALKRIAERNGIRQADIVRESGLTRSHVSRLFKGDQKMVYDADVTAILRVFRRNPREQAELEIGRAHVNSSHLGISYAVFCLKKKRAAHPRYRSEHS